MNAETRSKSERRREEKRENIIPSADSFLLRVSAFNPVFRVSPLWPSVSLCLCGDRPPLQPRIEIGCLADAVP